MANAHVQVPNLSLALRPPIDPRHPRPGALYHAYANCFDITKFPKFPIFHFDVAITPNEKLSARRKMEIVTELQTNVSPRNFRPMAVYDGKANLFAFHDVLGGAMQMTFDVNMSKRPPVPGQRPPGLFEVRLTQAQRLTIEDLKAILDGAGAGVPITTTPIQALNVLVRQSKFPSDFRKQFDYNGLEVWSGYFQSIRPTLNKLYINVDTITAVGYPSGKLLQHFIVAFLEMTNERDLYKLNPNHHHWQKLKGILHGLKVKQADVSKIRVVHGLVPDAGSFAFELNDGQETTVEDYYRNTKNKVLRYPNWPGIVTKRGEVIPFELCSIHPHQQYKKQLSPEMMTQVLNFSKKTPEMRFEAIKYGVKSLISSAYVAASGIEIDGNPMQITGRLLSPPGLQLGGQKTLKPSQGSWNLVGMQLKKPQRIFSWAVLSFDSKLKGGSSLKSFISNLVKCLTGLGIAVQNPEPFIHHGNPGRPETELSKIRNETSQANTGKPLILVVLEDNSDPVRKAVKHWGDITEGVPTQCVKSSNVGRANDQYLKNLCLKINVKLGGVNHTAFGEGIHGFQSSKAMVIGIDVSHPDPGVLRPSIAGVVASVDKYASQYVARTSVQPPRVEIVENLTGMLMEVLLLFNSYRKHVLKEDDVWPEHLIIFRDGVSEGEINSVVEREFSQVKDAIRQGWSHKGMPRTRPNVTFIVVGKRHHIRFFPSQKGTGDRSKNCPAGFIVDDKITAPGIFDFYLQSHGGILGTSRPGHYIVVKDENKFTADELQSFCFALCHTYARATRSISIPSPVYYADIVCGRSDYHFDPVFNLDDNNFNDDGEEVFDLQRWIDAYKPIHNNMKNDMYFV